MDEVKVLVDGKEEKSYILFCFSNGKIIEETKDVSMSDMAYAEQKLRFLNIANMAEIQDKPKDE